MNRDQVQGSWRQGKGRLKERWAQISDDEFTALAGRREQIAGRMQKAYGLARESSARQLSDWHKRMRQTVGLTRNSE